MIGQRLLHYQVVEKLGQGGMGVVYKARDSHLDRFIAVKVLPPELVANAERKSRFVQEAKAASALNHPNIIHIYDIASDDGQDFIAMEYVHGKTLDALIGRKGLRLTEALKYAIQIADALGKAHAAGIIHRDLKPANVMVNEDGVVKVLDFGLAKLIERSPINDDGAPTETLNLMERPPTEEGVVIGTVSYMSPEQAEGRKLDARSDIFAFGTLLYEMITGRRPFDADSKISTLNRILHEEPKPPSQLSEENLHDVEKIILRCLRKDPDRRFQTMADLRIALLDAKEDSESRKAHVVAASDGRRPRYLRYWPAAIVGLALITGLAWWTTLNTRPKSRPGPTALTHDSGLTFFPAISRDGKLLAYASDRADESNVDIWVQQVSGGQPGRLTTHPATDTQPDFSPDGTRIAFRSDRDGGGLYVIPTFGGSETKLADGGGAPRFSPDGQWIAYDVSMGSVRKVFVVRSTGGEPRQLTPELQPSMSPVWSPDGRHILVGSFHPTNPPTTPAWDWWVVPFDGAPATKTGIYKMLFEQGARTTNAANWSADNFVYLHGGPTQGQTNLWRIPISAKTFRPTEPPQRITSGTGGEWNPRVGPDGEVVFAAAVGSMNIWSFPLDADNGIVRGGMEQLTRISADGLDICVSPDGRTVAFDAERSGSLDLWLLDLESRKTSALLSGPNAEIPRKFTKSGSEIFYGSDDAGKRIANRVPVSGGTPKRMCENCCLHDVSSDEKSILSCDVPGGQSRGVVLLDVASGRRIDIVKHEKYTIGEARFSPDERWIAFRMDIHPDRSRLFVVPLTTGGLIAEKDWIPVTDGNGDASPQWSPNGNLLYFTSRQDGYVCIWARRLNPVTKQPVGEPFRIHHQHSEGRVMRFNPRITVASNRVLFRLVEIRSNIWMTKVP